MTHFLNHHFISAVSLSADGEPAPSTEVAAATEAAAAETAAATYSKVKCSGQNAKWVFSTLHF